MKRGLVLEGGTCRGIYSAGIMDAFLEEKIEFPYVVGVSAGISNGVSYVSKQFGRNLEIMDKYRNDKRYIGAGNYKKHKSLFGLDFVYGEIPQQLVPFDYKTFRQYEGKCLVGVTNALTGKPEYLDAMEDNENFNFLRASCAIPGYFPAIMINDTPYYDGGLASPIAVKQALKDGCNEIDMVVNVPKNLTPTELSNGYKIRRAAIDLNVPLLTNARLAAAFIEAFTSMTLDDIEIKSWDEYK